jgi:hypothetical protein
VNVAKLNDAFFLWRYILGSSCPSLHIRYSRALPRRLGRVDG